MSTILISGANGNLGQSVTARMLEDKRRVIALAGHHGAEELPASSGLIVHQLDLFDESLTGDFISKITSQYPDLEAAVLLVGGFSMGSIAETDHEGLEKMIRLNFYSAYHIVQKLLPHFLSREEGGQFILIGSKPGLHPSQGKDFFGYTLAKSMIFSLAEVINAEGKKKNVTATVIVPSTIDTPDNRSSMPDADFSTWVPPKNIADAISFVLSDTGRMLRNTVIKVYNKS